MPLGPRLSKTRSHDNSLLHAHTDDYNSWDRSRTSFGDLRSVRRTSLPRQVGATSEDKTGTAVEMAEGKNRLFRTTSASAMDPPSSSGASSTAGSVFESQRVPSRGGVESPRSPGLPDIKTTLDIEQAINLLQELKKTATTEELVALHRALLPTKESSVAVIPQLSAIDEHVSIPSAAPRGRVRSVIPPGLATRNGISDDPLRSREQIAKLTAASIEKKGSWFRETSSLAEIHARALSITSTGTAPDSNSLHTGAFRQGTLRITNGAASPEPGMLSKLAELDATTADAAVKPGVNLNAGLNRSPDHKRRRSADFHLGRSSMDSATDRVPFALAGRRKTQLDPAPSWPAPVSTLKVKHDDRNELPSQKHIKRNTIGDSTDLQTPTDVPRFGQRWAHRAAHLSKEYVLDCDITAGPFEVKQFELPDSVKRLSTVRDSDSEDMNTDACADALLKLTGGSQATCGYLGAERTSHGLDRSTTSGIEASRGSESPDDSRVRVLWKQDSGYCSEASASPLQATHETSTANKLDATPERPSQEKLAELAQSSPTKDDIDVEVSSLIVRPEQHDAPLSPRPHTVVTTASQADAKKRLSLAMFRSKSKSKSTRRGIEVKPSSKSTDKSIPPLPSRLSFHTEHSPTSKISPEAPKRRLQKRMPEAVRQQKNDEMVKLRQSMDISSPHNDSDSPVVGHEQRPKTIIHMVPPSRRASDADDESKIVSPTTPSIWRGRSKSYGRKRSSTVHESNAEESSKPSAPSTPSRRRSKSNGVAGARNARRPSVEVASLSCLRSNDPDSQNMSDSPSHSDFSSVARALDTTSHVGCNALSATVPKTLSRTKSSRSLRSKASSSHITLRQSLDSGPRPPSSKIGFEANIPVTQLAITARSQKSVEDLFPEWQSKPASKDNSPAAQEALIQQAFPYAGSSRVASECIPPLPELPADLNFKVSRAEEMVAKKLRLSPNSSSTASLRSSEDSVSPSNNKQVRGKKVSPPRPEPSRLMIEAPPEPESSGSLSPSTTEVRPRFSFDEIPKPGYLPYRPPASSPTLTSPHDAQHPGWPGWETQAHLWKQKRASLQSATQGKILSIEADQHAPSDGPCSPSIVVSRYITPLASQKVRNADHPRSGSDPIKAQTPEPREASQENLPVPVGNVKRSNSIVSTATVVTMWSSDDRPSKVTIDRQDGGATAVSATTTTTTTVSTVSSRLYKNATHSVDALDRQPNASSDRFVAYRPQDSHAAERSRALNLARRSCHIRDDAESQTPHQTGSSRSDGLLVGERYSGGLGYGWHRETGFTGSAGLRNGGAGGSTEKKKMISGVSGQHWRSVEEFGLDLRDVPVFLRRV